MQNGRLDAILVHDIRSDDVYVGYALIKQILGDCCSSQRYAIYWASSSFTHVIVLYVKLNKISELICAAELLPLFRLRKQFH